LGANGEPKVSVAHRDDEWIVVRINAHYPLASYSNLFRDPSHYLSTALVGSRMSQEERKRTGSAQSYQKDLPIYFIGKANYVWPTMDEHADGYGLIGPRTKNHYPAGEFRNGRNAEVGVKGNFDKIGRNIPERLYGILEDVARRFNDKELARHVQHLRTETPEYRAANGMDRKGFVRKKGSPENQGFDPVDSPPAPDWAALAEEKRRIAAEEEERIRQQEQAQKFMESHSRFDEKRGVWVRDPPKPKPRRQYVIPMEERRWARSKQRSGLVWTDQGWVPRKEVDSDPRYNAPLYERSFRDVPSRLYHGTSARAVDSIFASGQLNTSNSAFMGEGVYLTPSGKLAKAYAERAAGLRKQDARILEINIEGLERDNRHLVMRYQKAKHTSVLDEPAHIYTVDTPIPIAYIKQVWTPGGAIPSPLPVAKANPKSRQEWFEDWAKLINMKNKELEAFLESPLGKKAGLSASEAKAQGIHSGRVSGKAILRMRKKIGLGGPKDYIKGPVHAKAVFQKAKRVWNDNDWEWCARQVRFNKRFMGDWMGKRKGPLVRDGQPTRRLLALWVWGFDPWRYARKVEKRKTMPKCPKVPWIGMTEKRMYGVQKNEVRMNPQTSLPGLGEPTEDPAEIAPHLDWPMWSAPVWTPRNLIPDDAVLVRPKMGEPYYHIRKEDLDALLTSQEYLQAQEAHRQQVLREAQEKRQELERQGQQFIDDYRSNPPWINVGAVLIYKGKHRTWDNGKQGIEAGDIVKVTQMGNLEDPQQGALSYVRIEPVKSFIMTRPKGFPLGMVERDFEPAPSSLEDVLPDHLVNPPPAFKEWEEFIYEGPEQTLGITLRIGDVYKIVAVRDGPTVPSYLLGWPWTSGNNTGYTPVGWVSEGFIVTNFRRKDTQPMEDALPDHLVNPPNIPFPIPEEYQDRLEKQLAHEMTQEGYRPLRVQQDFIDSGGYDDQPSDWSYVQGEYQEFLDEIEAQDWDEAYAEYSDVEGHTAYFLWTNYGIDMPVYTHGHIDKVLFRIRVFEDLFKHYGYEFGPEFLKGGSNYEKVFKVRTALDAAADAQGKPRVKDSDEQLSAVVRSVVEARKNPAPNNLSRDFERMKEMAYDVRSKELGGGFNGREWWNQQIPQIEARYGTEPLEARWLIPLDTTGFDPSDKSQEFDDNGVKPLHFLNQIKRIPMTKPPTPERIMQVALNIGQGQVHGIIPEDYGLGDFIAFDNPRKIHLTVRKEKGKDGEPDSTRIDAHVESRVLKGRKKNVGFLNYYEADQLHFEPVEPYIMLEYIKVDKKWRGKGIAKKLMEKFLSLNEGRTIRGFVNNTGIIPFYEQFGFEHGEANEVIRRNPRTPGGKKFPTRYLTGLTALERMIAEDEIDKGYEYDANDPKAYE